MNKKDVNDISLTYRQRFLKNQLSFNKKYREVFNKIADDFSYLSGDPNARFTKSFKFNGVINNKIDIIIESFHDQTLSLTEQQIEKSWNLSNSKNDTIVKDYLGTISAIKAKQAASYFLPNIPALKAFISGDRGAGTLSDAIWKVSDQLRSELETHLGIGIMNGDSAQVISRRIRQYLNDPTALFRRVRDANGNLVASKRMIQNASGQGRYNSAYKNALRVARTETNMAYLLSDHTRWQQMDMVKGVKISLSAQHHIWDICDSCVGIYPKDFVFIGWHSQCMCHAVPELSSEEDFLNYLDTGIEDKNNQVSIYPDNFQNYVKDNFDRLSNYKNPPYWMQDNAGVIKKIMK